MTYDFHGGWDTCTGHNSPLHVGSEDEGDMRYFNCVRKQTSNHLQRGDGEEPGSCVCWERGFLFGGQ